MTRKHISKAWIAGAATLVAIAAGFTCANGQVVLSDADPDSRIMSSTIDEIKADKALYRYAWRTGASAFAKNCTRCHGSEGRGTLGVPALNDKAWLWGGDFESIYWTIQYGVRGKNGLARATTMPDFSAGKILSDEQATKLAQFVLTLNDDPDFDSETGEQFTFLCATCHGPYGGGYRGYGAPSLIDDYWLYGGTVGDIKKQILGARHGKMPAWSGVLPDPTVKSLAVYVHSLGGGE